MGHESIYTEIRMLCQAQRSIQLTGMLLDRLKTPKNMPHKITTQLDMNSYKNKYIKMTRNVSKHNLQMFGKT